MEIKRGLEEEFLKNLDYFTNTKGRFEIFSDCVLLLHAINQYYGILCDGLLEDDPNFPGYSDLLPAFWNENDIKSFRYKKDDETIYMKCIDLEHSIGINMVSCKDNGNIISCELPYSDFSSVNSGELDKTGKPLELKYYNKILSKLEVKGKEKSEDKKKAEESSHSSVGMHPNPLLIRPSSHPAGGFIRPTGLGPEHPFSNPFGVDNYVGPSSSMFHPEYYGRPGGIARPPYRYDHPGLIGEPDPDFFLPPGSQPPGFPHIQPSPGFPALAPGFPRMGGPGGFGGGFPYS